MSPMSPKCGTYAGWFEHRKRKEPQCDACRQARTDYQRAYRRRGSDKWLNKKAGTAVRGLGWPR